jgi:cytochrome c5
MLKLVVSACVAMAFSTAILASLPSGVSHAAEQEKTDPAQITRGVKAWQENCNRCHNYRDPKELSDYEWDVSVSHMRRLGNIPGNVARDIEAFLKASN